MKKYKDKIALLLILVMLLTNITGFAEVAPPEIPVPELTGMGVESEDSTEVESYIKGFELLKNSYFIDSQQTTYTRDIARMAAFGVIKNGGSINYEPKKEISKQELVEFLVRMSGQEATVLQNVLNNADGMGNEAVARLMEDEYITQAIALGIITANEQFDMRAAATKEQTALWIAKMLGTAATYQNADVVYSFDDWVDITPSSRGLIETLVTDKVMDVDNDGKFNPNRPVTKGEVAYILNNMSDQMYDELGITSTIGLVIGEKDTNIQKTTYLIKEKRFVIRNMDGTLTTAVTRVNKGNNAVNDFVVLKNNILAGSKRLDIGDQIEYLIRNDQVIYAEVFGDDSVREQIKRENDEGENLNIYYGYINRKIKEEKWSDGSYYSVDRLRTAIYNGLVFDIVVDDNLTTGIKNDIIVYKDDKIGGVDLLSEGDVIELLVRDEKNIVYVLVKKPTQGKVSGTIRFVDTDLETGTTMLTVFDYDDNIKKYEVTSYADISINGQLATTSDLKYGQDVLLAITNGYVTKIAAETFINPGHISKNSKMRFATVSNVDSYGNINVTYNNGEKKLIKVPNETTISKAGNIVTVFALKEGDKVKLFFDDIYTDVASIIEVEGREQIVQNIYRGLVQDVNVYKNEVTIIEPSILNNAQWKNEGVSYTKTFAIEDDIGIYVRGEKIDLSTLSKLYRNKPIYFAVRDDYSKETVIQANVSLGGERFATDKIEDLDRVVGNFELQDNNNNVVFNEGTIFIKNSKIVDGASLDKRDDVVVVSDYYRGQDNANVVRITSDAEKIFDNIYVGALDKVYSVGFTLRNYSTISGNQWSDAITYSSSLFSYFNNQKIVDITDKTDFNSLSSYDFYHGGYSKEENKVVSLPGLDHYRYYSVLVTDNERSMIGMNIRHQGLLDGVLLDPLLAEEKLIAPEIDKYTSGFVLTRGTIASFDTKWQRVEMTDSHDWAEDYGRWNANRGNSSVEYRDAIFVKNNKRIDFEELNVGDYIYVLRDDEDALVILVEEL